MMKTLVNALRLFICAIFTIQLMGCGTLMYPERRGQKGGRLDIGITVLDGIGLLFFIIPGVIAFCVDFSNGTIYLPEHRMMTSLNIKDLKEVRFDPKHTTLASLESIIKSETGRNVDLAQDNVKVSRLASLNDMVDQFALNQPINQNNRIALLQGDKNEHTE